MSAKAQSVIARNMDRFRETQASMPWFGRTSQYSIESDWDLVEAWDCIQDRLDEATEMAKTVYDLPRQVG